MTPRQLPILMSGPMVRATLEGRKTQTRRPVKWPDWVTKDERLMLASQNPATGLAYMVDGRLRNRFTCPYGAPGDLLYVRERHWVVELEGHGSGPQFLVYDDEFVDGLPEPKEVRLWRRTDGKPRRYGCHPSIHMPKWAARLWLEVTDVQVERVQDISEEGARAEGVWPELPGDGPVDPERLKYEHGLWSSVNYRDGFEMAWRDIYGDDSWDLNPFVWAITYAPTTPPAEVRR